MHARVALQRQRYVAVADYPIEHRNQRGLPVGGRSVAHGENAVAGLQSRPRRVRTWRNIADRRQQRRHAARKNHPVRQDREQEVEGRPRQQNSNAGNYRSLIKRAPCIFGRHGALTTIKKTDIATQGNRREAVLGAIIATHPGQQRLAEAYREPQYLHARPAANDVVTILVYGNQDADRDNEGQQIGQQVTH